MARATSPTRQAPVKRHAAATTPTPVAKTTTTPKYWYIDVSLVGRDGNAFAILGAVGNALRAAGVSQDQINDFYTEARQGDYDHLLRTVMSWVNVV
jgi:hypothetical protein